jgi:sugar (pentulose or hexulose) kinase
MAGREYRTIADTEVKASAADMAGVVARGVMALPSFVAGTGPYGLMRGRWSPEPDGLENGERAAVASLYCALVTETCLALAGAEGPVIVEGPFARNAMFLAALAARLPAVVVARPDATGTTEGAALLVFGADARPLPAPDPPPVAPLAVDLGAYADAWRQRVRETSNA